MDSSPRKVFIDLIHDLHDLSLVFDGKIDIKCLSNSEIEILKSFYNNLSLTVKLGYSIDNLSSTKLHSHLSLLLELSVELLSRNVENKDEVLLEEFLAHVLNIFRFLFRVRFYGNHTNNKDISKIRNLLLNSIQINVSIKYYQHLYNNFILPILFNFVFYTNEWIKNLNHILTESCFIHNQSDVGEHKLESNKIVCESSEAVILELSQESPVVSVDKIDSQAILFMPFQLKSITVRAVRNYLISNLDNEESFLNSQVPSQLYNDINFVEPQRTEIYCNYLYNILECCPYKLKEVISQQFCISNDNNQT